MNSKSHARFEENVRPGLRREGDLVFRLSGGPQARRKVSLIISRQQHDNGCRLAKRVLKPLRDRGRRLLRQIDRLDPLQGSEANGSEKLEETIPSGEVSSVDY